MISVDVSVVIPCFNCSKTIERAYQSILNQTEVPNEIIFIDDFSSDETLALIEKITNTSPVRIKIIALKNNTGPASARNIGIDSAKNSLIAFLDSDDAWHPSKIQTQRDVMMKDSSIKLSGHGVILFNNDLKEDDLYKKLDVKEITLNKLLFKNYFNTPSVMIRRESLRFPKNKSYAEDYYFWMEIAKSGAHMVFLDKNLAYIFKPFFGSGGLSKAIFKMHYSEILILYNVARDNFKKLPLVLLSIIFAHLKFWRRLFIVLKNKIMNS